MITVRTNGKATHAYVGYTFVPMDPDTEKPDPIKLALAKLKIDCRRDRSAMMNDWRDRLGLRSFGQTAWWLR